MYKVNTVGYLAKVLCKRCGKNALKQNAPVEDVNEVDGTNGRPETIEVKSDGILARCEGPN
jgi:hypothetical protein